MPTKPPDSPLEIAYNSAVQSFVRRDHVGTHASLRRLLKLIAELPIAAEPWYNAGLVVGGGAGDAQMWRFRVLKLLISAYASLYSDPPQRVDDLPPNLVQFLPPADPDLMLNHALTICHSTLATSADSSVTSPLPPQLLSTLILAALKLQPAGPALAFARRTTESWLADLPHEWLESIRSFSRSTSARTDNQRERNRESYLKVVELFVGEVLAREGEFEMARAFLDGDEMLESKRKEALYRQLRSVEAHSRASSVQALPPAPSPSGSLVLPTPSSGRSRRSSSSSSSSERTARPKSAVVGGVSTHTASRVPVSKGKGKGKERETVVDTDGDAHSSQTNSTFPLPKEIHVNPPTSRSLRQASTYDVRQRLQTVIGLIPSSVRSRLTSPIWVLSYILPIPLFILLLISWLRRSRRRGSGAVVGGSVVAGDLRQRLEDLTNRDGGRGLRAWVGYWIKWWWARFAGVWKMGTTLTYL